MPVVPKLVLKPGREKSLLRRHPWVFAGAIDRLEGSAAPGDTVDVADASGAWLGRAAYSPRSQIAARMWSFDAGVEIDAAFIRARLASALAARRTDGASTDACAAERLVNAESDGLPGVVVDRYADVLVCQLLSAGAEHFRETLAEELAHLVPCASVYERSDAEVRSKEGLEPRTGVMAGAEPPELVEIAEASLRFLVDVRNGHKTGFYLDQRDNRVALREHAAGTEVLNAFAYTGAFAVHALDAGAMRVTNVESSAASLALARRNAELNGQDLERLEQVEGDVFRVLRNYRDSRRSFDVIVLDPPKFAESKTQLERAARGYKDINLLALKLLRPGGVLMTFSCSGLMTPELFQKIVADAALDAGRTVRIVRWLRQAPDHAVAAAFPEGAYLKGLVCRAE